MELHGNKMKKILSPYDSDSLYVLSSRMGIQVILVMKHFLKMIHLHRINI